MKLNSKGQALLLVIAAMTVALALGINVSMRTLQSISRTSRSDTSERILAAAEGGIERVLKLPAGVLDGGINNAADCALLGSDVSYTPSAGCVVNFQPTAPDTINAKAAVVVSDFTYNAPSNTYKFKVEQDSVTEVNVAKSSAFSLNICWTPTNRSDLYYIIYSDSGIISKNGWRASSVSGSPIPPYNPHNFGIAAGVSRYCTGNISIPANAGGLRIKSIGGDSIVEVISASNSLPKQGHKIVSTGYLATDVTTKKVITVYKSLPFLPGIFDFGIFTQGALIN